MLPRRASPEPKIDATNVVVFMKRSTKGLGSKLPTGQKAAAHLERLQAVEAGAKKQSLGLWAG